MVQWWQFLFPQTSECRDEISRFWSIFGTINKAGRSSFPLGSSRNLTAYQICLQGSAGGLEVFWSKGSAELFHYLNFPEERKIYNQLHSGNINLRTIKPEERFQHRSSLRNSLFPGHSLQKPNPAMAEHLQQHFCDVWNTDSQHREIMS